MLHSAFYLTFYLLVATFSSSAQPSSRIIRTSSFLIIFLSIAYSCKVEQWFQILFPSCSFTPSLSSCYHLRGLSALQSDQVCMHLWVTDRRPSICLVDYSKWWLYQQPHIHTPLNCHWNCIRSLCDFKWETDSWGNEWCFGFMMEARIV